jgi:LmbE family N-acetylglucosaminyl deacetylase
MKLLVIVAHPDDETFGTGSVIARAAQRGADVVVCCATHGELGEARPDSVPEGATLAEVRAGELRDAAALLGARRVRLLEFEDSGWNGHCSSRSLVGAAFDEVVAAVRNVVADERPDVVVTLDPNGGDGHRDHVRIAQATTVAFDEAAPEGSTLYYWCLVRSVMRQWAAHNRGSVYDDVPDDDFGCPDELITTVVDVADLLPLRLDAISRHRSQASPYDDLPTDLQTAFLATDRLIRARPPWLGKQIESELTAATDAAAGPMGVGLPIRNLDPVLGGRDHAVVSARRRDGSA